MSRAYVTAARLRDIEQALQPRDLDVIRTVSNLRFLTGRQLQRWWFVEADTATANARTARRSLLRLVRLGVLARLPRAIGGVRAGSAGFTYYLDIAGQRLAEAHGWQPERRPRRSSTPGQLFLRHTLLVAELHLRMVESDRTRMSNIITEPPKRRVGAQLKRAFVYLRVSTDEQVGTDYLRDGLSMLGQRKEASAKATELDARILHEYKDPGKSAFVDLHKRSDFLAMLDEVKRCGKDPATRIHYVIIWSVSRFARDTVDHWQARKTMREAGTRLISITEPMVGEESSAAFMYESTVVAQSQYQSMHTGEQVKRGPLTKASVGGTYGPAKLGYVNDVDKLPDGRKVNTVRIDPDRGHFITLAFQLYDSGEYSISQLADELDRLGLRSRPSCRWPKPTKLSTSAVHRMLRNPYYAGWIVYKRGTDDEQVFLGRHEPLVDQDVFDRI